MEAISDAEKMIEELESRISELKGTRHCTACGCDVPEESVFCPKCGVKMEEDTYFDEEDKEVNEVVVTEITEEE